MNNSVDKKTEQETPQGRITTALVFLAIIGCFVPVVMATDRGQAGEMWSAPGRAEFVPLDMGFPELHPAHTLNADERTQADHTPVFVRIDQIRPLQEGEEESIFVDPPVDEETQLFGR